MHLIITKQCERVKGCLSFPFAYSTLFLFFVKEDPSVGGRSLFLFTLSIKAAKVLLLLGGGDVKSLFASLL